MSADSSWPLQQAVFAALTGDPTLMAMIAGVFDRVPQGTNFPYVTIGEATARAWGAAGLDGVEATLVLHVWSRARGRKEVKEIMAQIHRVLDDTNLTVPGHVLVSLRFGFAEYLPDADGITEHGIARYSAVTHLP
ncbi:MAG: DUF3168 domain-containing protein [Alphaproteobacteria bacterium]